MRRGWLIGCMSLAGTAALAQGAPSDDPQAQVPAQLQMPRPDPSSKNLWLRPPDDPDLRLHAGAMVLSLPTYPGSDEMRSVPFPILNGEYKERLTFGASRFGVGGGLGWNVIKGKRLEWSVGAEGVEARPESMARALAGMGDRPLGLFASTGLTWRQGPFEGVVGLRQGLRDGSGLGGVLRLALYLPLGTRWLFEARVAASAYDRFQAAYEYGVDEGQAARRQALLGSGDPRLLPGDDRVFHPSGGWALLQSSLAVGYAASEHGRLGLTLLQQEVQGASRQSPLVRKARTPGSVLGFSYQL